MLGEESDEFNMLTCKLVIIEALLEGFDKAYDKYLTNSIIKGVLLVFMRIIRIRQLEKKVSMKKKLLLMNKFTDLLNDEGSDLKWLENFLATVKEKEKYTRWLSLVEEQVKDHDEWLIGESKIIFNDTNSLPESVNKTLMLLHFESIKILLIWIADFTDYNKDKKISLIEQMPEQFKKKQFMNERFDFSQSGIESKVSGRIENLLKLFFCCK
jgi:hypothetical protein